MPARAKLKTLHLPLPAAQVPNDSGQIGDVHGTPDQVRRRAAVAIVLGSDDKLLLIRRAAREGDPWSGDMAFPGGRRHQDDADDLATARRETMEEVGLDLSQAELVGALPAQHSPVRRPDLAVTVSPFVFRVQDWTPFLPSDEVADVHLLDVHELLNAEHRGTFRYEGWGDLPCVRVGGTFIWGLTLRMLDDLAEACGLPRRDDWPGLPGKKG